MKRCPHQILPPLCPSCHRPPAAPPKKTRARFAKGRPTGDAARFAHPGFQDMTGVRVGRVLVESRAANVNGNARWHCLCDSERGGCGGHFVIEGIQLRAAAKREGAEDYSCPACRKVKRLRGEA